MINGSMIFTSVMKLRDQVRCSLIPLDSIRYYLIIRQCTCDCSTKFFWHLLWAFIGQKIGAKDLRLKLQKKSIQQATQSVKGSVSGGVRDLREKLSGTVYSQTVENDPPKAKLKAAPEISKPVRRSSIAEAAAMETKKIASTVSKKKSQQKATSLLRLVSPIFSLSTVLRLYQMVILPLKHEHAQPDSK